MTKELKAVIKSLEEAGITKDGIRILKDAIQTEMDSVECDRVEIKTSVAKIFFRHLLITPDIRERIENEINEI